jgi:putative heme-binding domain-containing protein
VAATAPLFAQQGLKDIPDPDPEIERKSFQVADGFEVNLYAADPRIAKPIQMNFDAAGRLWIASSEIYPQIQPGQKANDKILIVEDTDGDGTADKTTVFADGLLIPTGIEPGDGGAYVANSTEIIHLRDTDGDGKADSRRVMLSGFGTEDTHHIIHTFRWGVDGALYFNQSVYIHSHVETPHGVKRLGGGGIWRFRPETMELDIFCRGFVNPWGHQQDEWGQSFVTDGAYGEGINYVFPGSVWVTAPGAPRIVKGLNPGSPKHCGLEIVGGRHLPDDWQGDMLTNDFRGHRVCRFKISEDQSGYASREMPELIKTTHVAFRPIDVKMGPDGAIYIADWYNPIIQHGEVDFRDPRRDHTHGRIWRVTAKGRPLVPRPKLMNASNRELLDALKSPEYFTRHHAKRLLRERGLASETGRSQIADEMLSWVKGFNWSLYNSVAGIFDQRILEALWVCQALQIAEHRDGYECFSTMISHCINSQNYRCRAAAVRVFADMANRIKPVDREVTYRQLFRLATADEEHPRVRLEAVRAAVHVPQLDTLRQVMTILDKPVDANLDFAIWQTARDLQDVWLPAVQRGEFEFGGNVNHLLFALQAVNTPEVVPPLVKLLRAGQVAADKEEAVLAMIGRLGGGPELKLVFDLVANESSLPDKRSAGLLDVLADAARSRQVKPAGDLSGLAKLLDVESPSVRIAAAHTAGLWKLENTRQRLTVWATAADTPVELRQAALAGLVSLGGNASRSAIESVLQPDRPRDVRVQAVAALSGLDVTAAAKHAVELLKSWPAGENPSLLLASFLELKNGPESLTAALADQKTPSDVAKLAIRAVATSGRNLPDLAKALASAGGLTGMPQPLSVVEMSQLVAAVKEQGSPARGEIIYRRRDLLCQHCHGVSGAGGQVGPDLTSIGASAQIDYLIDSLLLPNKNIKEGFQSIAVETKAGKVLTGVKVRQTDTALILRDSNDAELTVPLTEIEEQSSLTTSIMPTGQTDNLTRAELIDLVRFLSELGKVGPYAPSQARLARRWQVLSFPESSPSMASMKAGDDLHRLGMENFGGRGKLIWNPTYSVVSGDLPLESLPALQQFSPDAPALSVARCELKVTTGGPLRLRLNSPDGLRLWVDDKLTPIAAETTLNLPPGLHLLTFEVNRHDRTRDGLRWELLDVPDSTAQAQFVTGR